MQRRIKWCTWHAAAASAAVCCAARRRNRSSRSWSSWVAQLVLRCAACKRPHAQLVAASRLMSRLANTILRSWDQPALPCNVRVAAAGRVWLGAQGRRGGGSGQACGLALRTGGHASWKWRMSQPHAPLLSGWLTA